MSAKVAVIIPTYKRPGMLGRAIDSVLKQTYKNIKVYVVDDNNEGDMYRKETELFMEQYTGDSRLIYIKHQVNRNGSSARNTGINKSDAEYITFLDDDDFYEETKIERQLFELSKYQPNSSIQGVACLSRVINGFSRQNSEIKIEQKDFFEDILLGKVHFNTSTLMFRKAALEKLVGFDEMLNRYQDVDLLVRYTIHYRLLVINEPLVVLDQQDRANYSNVDVLLETKEYLKQKYSAVITESQLWNEYLITHKKDIIKAALFNKKWSLFFNSILTKPRLTLNEGISFFCEVVSKAFNYRFKR